MKENSDLLPHERCDFAVLGDRFPAKLDILAVEDSLGIEEQHDALKEVEDPDDAASDRSRGALVRIEEHDGGDEPNRVSVQHPLC